MRITNELNLPEAMVRAVTPRVSPIDRRRGAHISVTELIGPPRIKQLKDANDHLMVEDASDRIWMLFGTVVHQILFENASEKLKEHHLRLQRGEWTVCGTFDLLHEAPGIMVVNNRSIMTDWKCVSVFQYLFKDGDFAREAQLNIYRQMMVENGLKPPDELQNVMVYRDWRASESERSDGYPDARVEIKPRPVWPEAKVNAYIAGRLRAHGVTMPACTPEERLDKESVWATKKEGAKRALRLYSNENAANAAATEMQKQYPKEKIFVEHRPGEKTRCVKFCPVWAYCEVGVVARGGSLDEP